MRNTTAKIVKDKVKKHLKDTGDIDLEQQYQELYSKSMPGVIQGS